ERESARVRLSHPDQRRRRAESSGTTAPRARRGSGRVPPTGRGSERRGRSPRAPQGRSSPERATRGVCSAPESDAPAVGRVRTPPGGGWPPRPPRHTSFVDGEVVPALAKAESDERFAIRRLSAVPTTAILVGFAVVAALLHAFLVGRVHGPFVFMDELG